MSSATSYQPSFICPMAPRFRPVPLPFDDDECDFAAQSRELSYAFNDYDSDNTPPSSPERAAGLHLQLAKGIKLFQISSATGEITVPKTELAPGRLTARATNRRLLKVVLHLRRPGGTSQPVRLNIRNKTGIRLRDITRALTANANVRKAAQAIVLDSALLIGESAPSILANVSAQLHHLHTNEFSIGLSLYA